VGDKRLWCYVACQTNFGDTKNTAIICLATFGKNLGKAELSTNFGQAQDERRTSAIYKESYDKLGKN